MPEVLEHAGDLDVGWREIGGVFGEDGAFYLCAWGGHGWGRDGWMLRETVGVGMVCETLWEERPGSMCWHILSRPRRPVRLALLPLINEKISQ